MAALNPTAGTARGKRRVSVKTADYTVTARESGSIFTNEGDAGTIVFALPAAVRGLSYDFVVKATQALRIDPNGTETIALPTGAQQAAGKYIWADAIGEMIRIVCVKTGEWDCLGSIGTFTAEA